MASFTVEERIKIVTWYLQGMSGRKVSENFAALYPDRPIPTKDCVRRLHARFITTGCLVDGHIPRMRDNHVSNEENKALILAGTEINPEISLRSLECDLGISRNTCWKVLKTEGYKSFKKIRVQKLHDGDPILRMEFCEKWMESIHQHPRTHFKILFTDECTFYLDGHINPQNNRMWAKKNPMLYFEKHHQVRQKVNVWAGILGHRLLGPFFFEENINGVNYLTFLQDVVQPALNGMNNAFNVTFMHDGCPAHGARQVTDYLNEVYTDNWIGQRGPHRWPPRSPDLNPLDFFFWGYLKDNVFKSPCTSLPELQDRILGVSAAIPATMLRNAVTGFYHRLGYCLAVNGDHFEQLL